MILSDLSIRRPVFATVMVLALVTLGAFSYRWLPVEMYPNVEIPVISIVTKFPGASPESVEREVSKRLEEAVNGISGVKHVYSYSREGVSTVVVEFRLEERLNEVIQEARAKVNGVRGTLPKGIEDPIIQKMDIGCHPRRFARDPVTDPFAQGPDGPGREECQAPLRGNRRGRQGRPGRGLQARGQCGHRPRAPFGPGTGDRRRGRRPEVGKRQHPARPSQPRSDGSQPPGLGKAGPRREVSGDGDRRKGGQAHLPGRGCSGERRGRGAALTGAGGRRPGRLAGRDQTGGREYRGGRRLGQGDRGRAQGRASPGDDHPGRPRQLRLHPRVPRRRPADPDSRRAPHGPDRLLLHQLLAFHGDHRPHAADLGDLVVPAHEVPGDVDQRDDDDGPVARRRVS